MTSAPARRILRPAAGGDPLTLRLWVSPDAVTDALVRDQRLLVATVGYGVLMTDLPSRAAALPLAGPAQTGPRRREAESASERRSGRIAAARAGD